jgi:hypothetical protein
MRSSWRDSRNGTISEPETRQLFAVFAPSMGSQAVELKRAHCRRHAPRTTTLL